MGLKDESDEYIIKGGISHKELVASAKSIRMNDVNDIPSWRHISFDLKTL